MMKLRTAVVLGGVGLSVLGVAVAQQGCSSDSTATSTGAGKTPPKRPDGPATTSTDNRTYAIAELKLGLNNDWKKYGYDLDGKVSVSGAKDVCKPRAGADKKVHADGDSGIDNAFGQFIVPTLTSIPNVTDLEGTVNDAFKQGNFGVLFQVKGLVDGAANATGLSGQIFNALKLGKTPAFDKTDVWPVNKQLLSGGTVDSGSKIKFSNSYVSGGTFVSGDPSTVTLSLSLAGVSIDLDINNAVITFDAKTGTSGIIAGILDANKLGDQIKKVVPKIPQLACNTSIEGTVQSVVDTITSNADIMIDGKPNASAECDGISIGVGFTVKEVANPTTAVDPDPPGPPPNCSGDGGTDSGGAKDAGTD